MVNVQFPTAEPQFPQALPLSTIVYKWADARNITVTEAIRDLQKCIYTAAGKEDEENFLAPGKDFESGETLEIWPRAYFSRSGEITRESLKSASQVVTHSGGRMGLAYGTEKYWRAWRFLKMPVPDTEPANLREMLDEFMVKREDFKRWLLFHKYSLPEFWFTPKPTAQEIVERGRVSGKNQEDIANEVMTLYPSTSREDLGRLLPAKWNKYGPEQRDAAIKQGKRLWQKILQEDQHN